MFSVLSFSPNSPSLFFSLLTYQATTTSSKAPVRWLRCTDAATRTALKSAHRQSSALASQDRLRAQLELSLPALKVRHFWSVSQAWNSEDLACPAVFAILRNLKVSKVSINVNMHWSPRPTISWWAREVFCDVSQEVLMEDFITGLLGRCVSKPFGSFISRSYLASLFFPPCSLLPFLMHLPLHSLRG